MTITESDNTFYSLEPIGFDGWEQTVVSTSENGSKSMFVRRVGHLLPHLIVIARGGSMFSAVNSFIEEREQFSKAAA